MMNKISKPFLFLESFFPKKEKLTQDSDFLNFPTKNPSKNELDKLSRYFSENTLSRLKDYLKHVLVGNNGRAHCPFVKTIENRNGYYIKQFETINLTKSIYELEEAFKHFSPKKTFHSQKVDHITVVAIFYEDIAMSKEFFIELESQRNNMRQYFLEQGLMLAHMHPLHQLGSAKESSNNTNEELYVSGIPLLMVRRMHKEDIIFMHKKEEIIAYQKYFEPALVKSTCPFKKFLTLFSF